MVDSIGKTIIVRGSPYYRTPYEVANVIAKVGRRLMWSG